MFILGDITKACTFDPFTHVYMISVGFPPALWKRLATIWNNSTPNSCQYLICFSPEKKLEEYDFAVEFVAEADTSMHGSGGTIRCICTNEANLSTCYVILYFNPHTIY